MKLQKIILVSAALFLIVGGLVSSGFFGLNWQSLEKNLNLKLPQLENRIDLPQIDESVRVVTEESTVITAVEKVSPAVVTIGIKTTARVGGLFEIDPFDPFSPFRQQPGQTRELEQDIGSGFVVNPDGLIVTNKHVVGQIDAQYHVITKDDKTFEVDKIYRDPVNDLAILKINARNLPTIEMGDSNKIKVGQLAIAIGTALGEFRNTVTTGVISGIGRGITAGSPFEDSAERLDNVIQTDAAINPGNSGGPLVNSGGQVVGVNTAVSAEGQNIGFALPINIVKEALDNFNNTGQFDRPYLGVRYKVVTRDISILNEIPEGAYIMEVVPGSPAEQAGIKVEDIITRIDNTRLTGENSELSKAISGKKVGDRVRITIWANGEERIIDVTLGNQNE